MVSNSHREHLLRTSSAILISIIDNNPENNGFSQGTCFPLLLQPDRFFQSSQTSNSWRMLFNEQAVFEKVQDNDSTKNAIFESNIFPFTNESIRLFYFVTIYKNSLYGIEVCRLGDFALSSFNKFRRFCV